MARITKSIEKGYTVVPQSITRKSGLSLKAMGLLTLLLSLPDGWEFSVNGVMSLVPDGRDSIRSGISELESAGFLKRSRVRDEKGALRGGDWVVYDHPTSENPTSENPTLVFPPQLNNQEVSNQEEMDLSFSLRSKDIVEHLNEVTGSSFRASSQKTVRLLRARLNEGYEVDDFKAVIDVKAREWKDDPKMSRYLRPETLFGTKFEGYLQEARCCRGDSARSDFADYF